MQMSPAADKPQLPSTNYTPAAAPRAPAAPRKETVDLNLGRKSGTKDDAGKQQQQRHLDSGYAWILLLTMFLLQSVSGGSQRVYGLIFARQVQSAGGLDRQRASWPLVSASFVENLAVCLTPYLLARHQLSWRHLQLASSALLAIASLGAYLSRSLLIDCLCLGLVQGLGLSISTVLLLAVNNDYFDRYRTTAHGLAMSGSTCGTLYLTPLIEWLLSGQKEDAHSFRVAYLALGLLFILCLPLALLVVPRKSMLSAEDENSNQNLSNNQARKVSSFERSFERQTSVASINVECRIRRISSTLSFQNSQICSACLTNWPSPQVGKMETVEIGSANPLPKEESIRNLLKNPFLHCAWLMLALYFTISRCLMILLPDLAQDYGLNSKQGNQLLAYWSLGELLGRLLLGPLIDLRLVSLRHCIAWTCLALGTSLLSLSSPLAALDFAATTANLLVASTVAVAALASLEYVLINVLLVEYLGVHLVATCYSLASLIAAVPLLLRPALIGLFRDRLGSYQGLLLLLALCSALFGLLFGLLEPPLRRRWPSKNSPTSSR